MNRKQLILRISIATAFLLLIIAGLVYVRERQKSQSRVEDRIPLQGLAYCTENPVTPCVISFSLDSEDNMLVNLLTEGVFYPDFYLKIKTNDAEHIYVCQKVSKFATTVYCTGQKLSIGEVYQFLIISLREDVLLAQGNFPIIGMALGTPVVFVETPTVTPTDIFGPPGTPTPFITSYPSYP